MAVCTVYTVKSLNPTCSNISTPTKTHLSSNQKNVVVFTTTHKTITKKANTLISCSAEVKTVVIGLAADSGCGKSFMRRRRRATERRLTSVFQHPDQRHDHRDLLGRLSLTGQNREKGKGSDST